MRFCHRQNKKIAYSFTVSLQVLLIFLFLVAFYFGYILYIEKESFENQINFVIEDLTKDLKYYIPNIKNKGQILSKLDEEISKLQKKTKSNIAIDKKNQWYKTISINIAISLGVGLIVFFLILTMFDYCLPVTYTLYESIFTIGFVALTEYAFLQLVTKNYIATDPNEIKYNIAKAVYNFSQNPKTKKIPAGKLTSIPTPSYITRDPKHSLKPDPKPSKKELSIPGIIGISIGVIAFMIILYSVYTNTIRNDTIGLCINITLHVLILFLFLTILFFTVISGYEQQQVKSQLDPLINNGVNNALTYFNSWWDMEVKPLKDALQPLDPALTFAFPWKIVGEYSKIKMYDNIQPSEEVINNNDKLRFNSIITVLILFFILVLLIVYFKYIKRRKFGLRFILNENFFIFSFVGVIEFLFFWFIIKNYNPIYPQEAEVVALQSLEKVVKNL